MAVGTYSKITLLFAVLTGLLLTIGYVFGIYFFGDLVPVTGLALGLAAMLNFVSYFYSGSLVLRMSRAKVIQETDNPTLFRIVRTLPGRRTSRCPRWA